MAAGRSARWQVPAIAPASGGRPHGCAGVRAGAPGSVTTRS